MRFLLRFLLGSQIGALLLLLLDGGGFGGCQPVQALVELVPFLVQLRGPLVQLLLALLEGQAGVTRGVVQLRDPGVNLGLAVVQVPLSGPQMAGQLGRLGAKLLSDRFGRFGRQGPRGRLHDALCPDGRLLCLLGPKRMRLVDSLFDRSGRLGGLSLGFGLGHSDWPCV